MFGVTHVLSHVLGCRMRQDGTSLAGIFRAVDGAKLKLGVTEYSVSEATFDATLRSGPFAGSSCFLLVPFALRGE